MNIIETLEINGLWGDNSKAVKFNFNEDVNFIIGINGTGKTTVINLLAAALQGDFQTLDKISFEKILIKLKNVESKTKPVIELVKKPNKRTPFDDIIYNIQEKTTGKVQTYNLNNFAESISYRDNHRYLMERRVMVAHSGILEALNNLIKVSWLSVHRTNLYEQREPRAYEAPVDIKLKEIVADLVKYFSTLDKRSLEKQNSFQENVFLALLYNKGVMKNVFAHYQEGKENPEVNKEVLREIFKQFKLDPAKTNPKIEQHFQKYAEARGALKSSDPIGMEEISAIVLNNRIDTIIDEWLNFRKNKDEIFQPQSKFLEVLNTMFRNKKVSVDEKNEIKITTDGNKPLPIASLSSGEKQLLIVLGQALLQRNEKWIYIADEPELSLHVKWQDALVDNIRKLNPNGQIIFATHSPDIVSQYSDRVFDMENLI